MFNIPKPLVPLGSIPLYDGPPAPCPHCEDPCCRLLEWYDKGEVAGRFFQCQLNKAIDKANKEARR